MVEMVQMAIMMLILTLTKTLTIVANESPMVPDPFLLMAILAMTLPFNGAIGCIRHWRQWITICSIFVAIAADGAVGEMSNSL